MKIPSNLFEIRYSKLFNVKSVDLISIVDRTEAEARVV